MSNARGKTYRPWDPEHYRHVAHSPEAKLPEDDLGRVDEFRIPG
jgi:hypothetical protein